MQRSIAQHLAALAGPGTKILLVTFHHDMNGGPPFSVPADEVARLFVRLDGGHRLLAQLLYGTGMRLMEGVRLRVKDVDFERRAIVVREGKGAKDRVVMLPASLVPALRAQMGCSRLLWSADREVGRGGVQLPNALERKYPRVRPAFDVPHAAPGRWSVGSGGGAQHRRQRRKVPGRGVSRTEVERGSARDHRAGCANRPGDARSVGGTARRHEPVTDHGEDDETARHVEHQLARVGRGGTHRLHGRVVLIGPPPRDVGEGLVLPEDRVGGNLTLAPGGREGLEADAA